MQQPINLSSTDLERKMNYAAFCAMRDVSEPIVNALRLMEWQSRYFVRDEVVLVAAAAKPSAKIFQFRARA